MPRSGGLSEHSHPAPPSGLPDALDGLADRLHSVAIHMLRHVRIEDEKSGISPARLSALSVVVMTGPLRIGELAEAEQVSAPTMSRLVQALEEEDLVERLPDPEDGRGVRIRATPVGQRLLMAARRRRLQRLRKELEKMPQPELEVVAQAVDALEEWF